MLRESIVFMVLAVIAAICWLTGIAGTATVIAKFSFFVFTSVCFFCALTTVMSQRGEVMNHDYTEGV